MKIYRVLLISITALVLTSCISTKTLKATSTVPAGTEVSYSRVVNPAYATDYLDANVITEVEFYSAGKANNVATKIPKGYVVFQIIPIGGSPENAPFGGGLIGDYAFLPKGQSDIIFDLKKGDKIRMTGGTRVQKYYLNGIEIIEFIASSVEKI